MKMTDLRDLIEREIEQHLEWPTADKSHITTVSAKLFAEHVARLYSDHIPDAEKMVEPAVQREPASGVALSRDDLIQCLLATRGQSEGTTADAIMSMLTTAPQPAEQQPLKPILALDAATHLTNWLDMNWCECEGVHTCGYNEVKRTRDALLGAAEQQPAQDVTALVEALQTACEYLPIGSRALEMASIALAAHRKGGEHEDD